jgi:hypothetical protein
MTDESPPDTAMPGTRTLPPDPGKRTAVPGKQQLWFRGRSHLSAGAVGRVRPAMVLQAGDRVTLRTDAAPRADSVHEVA